MLVARNGPHNVAADFMKTTVRGRLLPNHPPNY